MDLVFYGDSITESWRGTQLGEPLGKFSEVPAVWDKHFGKLKAAAYAIAGMW